MLHPILVLCALAMPAANGPRVHVSAAATIAVPGDASIIARSGFDPLILPPGERTPLAALRGGRIEPLKGEWSIPPSGAEPRCAFSGDPIVVVTGPATLGYGSEAVHAMPLRELVAGRPQSAALVLPTGLRSPLVVSSGKRLLATGFAQRERSLLDEVVALLTGKSGAGLVVYDVSGAKPKLLASVPRFSDHAEDNLASAVTRDGLVHLIATEVVMAHGNKARVHYLRFDPASGKWLGDEIVAERSDFTSSLTHPAPGRARQRPRRLLDRRRRREDAAQRRRLRAANR